MKFCNLTIDSQDIMDLYGSIDPGDKSTKPDVAIKKAKFIKAKDSLKKFRLKI